MEKGEADFELYFDEIIDGTYRWIDVGGTLLVAAGLQEDADGIQLQEHLTGHRVKEGDVGKGRRGQQEDFPRRGLLAQF